VDGPIGVAINGVPIFNPCKQGGCQNGDTKVLASWTPAMATQAVVAPGDHAHTVQMQIRADVKSSNANGFSSITLQLPLAFQQVLVVSCQPKQVWLKPNTPSPAISF
jgi:hypothetical protein